MRNGRRPRHLSLVGQSRQARSDSIGDRRGVLPLARTGTVVRKRVSAAQSFMAPRPSLLYP